MEGEDALLRQCGRCRQLRPLSRYKPNAKLCEACVNTFSVKHITARELGIHGIGRGLVLLPKAKDLLRQWRRQELMGQRT